MNDKNQKLLFSDSDEETVVITLTDEDGQDIDAEIMVRIVSQIVRSKQSIIGIAY